MSRIGWVSAGVVVAIIVVIMVALFREALSGPTFRAEDYGSYEECIRGIPAEWRPGSLEQSGAEASCHYVHQRAPGR